MGHLHISKHTHLNVCLHRLTLKGYMDRTRCECEIPHGVSASPRLKQCQTLACVTCTDGAELESNCRVGTWRMWRDHRSKHATLAFWDLNHAKKKTRGKNRNPPSSTLKSEIRCPKRCPQRVSPGLVPGSSFGSPKPCPKPWPQVVPRSVPQVVPR